MDRESIPVKGERPTKSLPPGTRGELDNEKPTDGSDRGDGLGGSNICGTYPGTGPPDPVAALLLCSSHGSGPSWIGRSRESSASSEVSQSCFDASDTLCGPH
jgi:hypothetical protein